MALTQTRTETDSTTDSIQTSDSAARPALERVLSTSDHKTIGRMWIGAGAAFVLLALVLSTIASIELIDLGSVGLFEDEGQFVQAWSAGRTLLLFGGVIPVLIGLATYLTPLQVGASAIAFGRGAAGAFWTWLLATGILILAVVANGGPAGGSKDAVLLWILALGTMLVGFCWAFVCIATTILGARTIGMRLEHVPISTWSFLVFSLLGLLTLPILIGELGLAYADVSADYLSTKVDRQALLSILNSLSLAPALYWVGIPVLGMGLDVVATQSESRVRFHKPALALIGSLLVLSFGADILTFGGRGRAIEFDNAVLVLGVLAAVVPILLLLGMAADAVKNGKPATNTPLVAGMAAMALLAVGALVALLALIEPILEFVADASNSEIDVSSALRLADSSFHEGIRGLILGAVLLGIVSSVHHWGHKIWGRSLDDKLGMLSILLVSAGTIAWGGAYVISGMLEQPALPGIGVGPKDGVEVLNVLATIGFAVLGLGALVFLANLARTALGTGTTPEPWSGQSLEWTTSSPPSLGNFASAPVMESTSGMAVLSQPTPNKAEEA